MNNNIKEIILPDGKENWKNIYLVGYMGVGKSTVSRYLGRILDMPVIDLDRVIEEYYGKSIPEIFEEIEEEGFRALETLILTISITGNKVHYDILKGAVFSCGGGITLNEVNVFAMKNSGKIVWLTASPETIYERLSNNPDAENPSFNNCNRPLLKMDIGSIREMMELRESCYRDAADLIISTEGKTPEDVAGEIALTLGLIPTLS